MSQVTKTILWAIIPAIVAGAFSVAPTIYEQLSQPESHLAYSMTEGPCIGVDGKYRRIFSIRIVNSGKTILKHVVGQVLLQSGGIEGFNILEETGLKHKSASNDSVISLEIEILHPGEDLTVSAMILSSVADESPTFTLRSDEVLGSVDSLNMDEEPGRLDSIGAILAGGSVFLMTILSFKIARRRIMGYGHKREDIVFHILVKLGLTSLSNELKFLDRRITYLRTSDVLLSHGLNGTDQDREAAIAGLKCILLINNISDDSIVIVIDNLKTLEGDSFSSDEVRAIREGSVTIGDAGLIRTRVAEFVRDPAMYQNSSSGEV